eukprot:TRINITY_DN36159_c0_g1_i1.p1 TRINITY_DN36159_c0_g1~~TRINITY_DN36159_c0_g1_i1.p1  ORF type:complete len:117 (+),score=48.95 TRINITY_DN36159_c0_g1_i1:43-351(+)
MVPLTPQASDTRSGTPTEMDRLHHLQQELHRYVVENGELKKASSTLGTLQTRFRDLDKKHEVMLQMYGEKDEECRLLTKKFAESEAHFQRQMDFFIEKLGQK